jgi:aminoglycoside phosphotransferase (APT) family kinase protein
MDKNEDRLYLSESALSVEDMKQGYEAAVMKINSDLGRYVLKTWSKGSKPDIRFQYRLLNVLHERGLAVSRPVGWGIDPAGNHVLLTTYDGTAIDRLNDKKLADIANILSQIHRTRAEEIPDLPKYDFIGYFFPGISSHPDLHEELVPLVREAGLKQDRLIHGDFHLNNLVEDNGRYAVIDWTNGQLGDPGYDFAWSLTLKRLYVSERHAKAFRSAYLSVNELPREELERFEAIACLRWLLLNRSGGAPGGSNTIVRMRSILQANPHLKRIRI